MEKKSDLSERLSSSYSDILGNIERWRSSSLSEDEPDEDRRCFIIGVTGGTASGL